MDMNFFITEDLGYYSFYEWIANIYCKTPWSSDGWVYYLDKNCRPRVEGQLSGGYDFIGAKGRDINSGKDQNRPVYRYTPFVIGLSESNIVSYCKRHNLLN